MFLNPADVSDPDGADSLLPVTKLEYPAIAEFINRLNEATDKQYRLPSETEWEYALKGSSFAFPSVEGNTWKSGVTGALTPVNSFHPNTFGVYDLLGNAWECTGTLYENYQYHQLQYEYAKGMMVVRGGSYRTTPENVHSRNGQCSYEAPDTTFRLCLSVNES